MNPALSVQRAELSSLCTIASVCRLFLLSPLSSSPLFSSFFSLFRFPASPIRFFIYYSSTSSSIFRFCAFSYLSLSVSLLPILFTLFILALYALVPIPPSLAWHPGPSLPERRGSPVLILLAPRAGPVSWVSRPRPPGPIWPASRRFRVRAPASHAKTDGGQRA